MFEQTFVAETASRRSLAVVAAAAGQCVFVAAALAAPLLFTYDLPLREMAANFVLLTPPPPPAPPPPPTVKVEPRPPPERFDEVLRQPTKIPDQVALEELRSPSLDPLGAPSGVVGSFGAVGGVGDLPIDLGLPPAPKPIRVGGRVQAARIEKRVLPSYPVEAQQEGITGRVLLRAVIAKDGAVKSLKLNSGHPLLATAAIEAVRQWRYKPTRLNGRAVEVITEIEVIFTLTAPPEPPEDADEKGRKRGGR